MMNLFIEDARSFIVFSHNIFFSYFFCHFLFVTSFFSPYFQQIIFLHQFNHLAPRWRVQVLFSPGALFFIQQQFYPKVLSLSLKKNRSLLHDEKTGPCLLIWPQILDQHTRFTQGVKFQLIWVTLRKWPWFRVITLNQGQIMKLTSDSWSAPSIYSGCEFSAHLSDFEKMTLIHDHHPESGTNQGQIMKRTPDSWSAPSIYSGHHFSAHHTLSESLFWRAWQTNRQTDGHDT